MLALVSAGHMPLCLENWTPQTEVDIDVIKKAVADCQFYVIILGHRYGSIPKGRKNQKSYIELEFDFAKTSGLKILPFVMDEKLVREKRTGLQNTIDERAEIANEDKYWKFRKRLTELPGHNFYGRFSTPADIEKNLFGYFKEKHTGVRGYILEPTDKDDVNLLRVYARNPIVRELVQRIGQFTTVEGRLSEASPKKDALAKAFRDLHGDHVQRRFEKVFFESGSTVTFVAKYLADKLPTRAPIDDQPQQPLVTTNNVMAFLYLWLCSGVVCRPEPETPPTLHERYGAMLGSLTNRTRDPDYSLPPLPDFDREAVEQIEQLRKSFLLGIAKPERCIILAAASGLQISEKITAIRPRITEICKSDVPVTDERLLDTLRKCRGFHVGSYENKLFKRCLYRTGIPTVVFIHDSKIDCPIEVGKCHFLCDRGEPWTQFASVHPLSLWVACDADTCEVVKSKLTKHMPEGWHFITYGPASEYPIVIGHNSEFRKACDENRVALYQGPLRDMAGVPTRRSTRRRQAGDSGASRE